MLSIQGKNTEVVCNTLLQWTATPVSVDHILSELSTMIRCSSVALHGMAHSFTELHKAMRHMIILVIFCDCGFLFGGHGVVVLASSVFPLIQEDKRFVQPS